MAKNRLAPLYVLFYRFKKNTNKTNYKGQIQMKRVDVIYY